MSSDESQPRQITPDEYSIALRNATSTGELLRKKERQEETLSRAIDMIRQLVLIGTLVLVILLIIGSFVEHPSITAATTVSQKHKYFALSGLLTICGGYAISLWLVRGQPVLLLVLVFVGTSVLSFGLGWAVSELRRFT
jgi:drug/metabolite transporter (DMT)-like permease